MATMAMPAHATTPGRYREEEDSEDESCGSSMDIQTISEALMLLTDFATLDSGTYQSSFSFHSPRHLQHQHEPSLQEEEKHRRALRRLEQLLLQKDVQATPLPALWRALHRLHSNLAILQENEAHHVAEVKTMRDELAKANQNNAKLQKAVKLLKDRNASLERKLQRKQSLLKQARDFFRNAQELQKDLQQQNSVIKMQFHEQFLLHSSRERLESTDSNFSDADALLYPDTVAPASSSRTLEEDNYSLQSVGSSLITDEGVPVVKLFAQDDALTMSSTVNSSHTTSSDFSESSEELLGLMRHSCNVPGGPLNHPASPCKPGVYKLWYPQGQKVGLRFQTIPLNDLPAPPRGSLTQEILKDDNEDEGRKHMFRFPNILGMSPAPAQHPPTIPEDESKPRGHAVVVSAYLGSETNAEQPRPTLGARVVEINGEPVDPSWSLRKFYSVLSSAAGVEVGSERNSERNKLKQEESTFTIEEDSAPHEIETDEESSVVSSIDEKSKVHTFSISFRNDALTKKQRDRLSSSDRFESSEKQRERLNSSDRFESSEKQRERLNSSDRFDSYDFEQRHSGKEAQLPGSETKRDSMPFGLGFLRMGAGNSARNISSRVAEGAKNPSIHSAEGRRSPSIHGINEGQQKKENKKDEHPKKENKKEDSTEPSDKGPSNDKEQQKGKNPLFFWDRGDHKSSQQEKQQELEEKENSKDTAIEEKKADMSAEKKEMKTPAAATPSKGEVDPQDISEVSVSDHSSSSTENQSHNEAANPLENSKNTGSSRDGKENGPKQEPEKEASNKKPPRAMMGMGIPFFTPPKRNTVRKKTQECSEKLDTHASESQPDLMAETDESIPAPEKAGDEKETVLRSDDENPIEPVVDNELVPDGKQGNPAPASEDKRMFGVPFWRTSPKPAGIPASAANPQVKPLL